MHFDKHEIKIIYSSILKDTVHLNSSIKILKENSLKNSWKIAEQEEQLKALNLIRKKIEGNKEIF